MLDEKELVLSETSQLIEVLRGQATDGREETINTAKIVNDIQARIKAVTRKMIACVSELALYQATAKKLEVDSEMCAEALAVARHRLESGDAPTEDAEREWRRQLRVVEMRDVVAGAKAEELRVNALMCDVFPRLRGACWLFGSLFFSLLKVVRLHSLALHVTT